MCGIPLDNAVKVALRQNVSVRELSSAVAEAAGYGDEMAVTGQGPDGQLRKTTSGGFLSDPVSPWSRFLRSNPAPVVPIDSFTEAKGVDEERTL